MPIILTPCPYDPITRHREDDAKEAAIKRAESLEILESEIVTFGLIPFEDLQIVREVGKGGFSTVYEVMYRDRRLAAKVLAHRGLNNEKLKQEMMHEVHVLSRLQHAHIVKLMGACSVGQNLCLYTEFSDRGSMFSQ